MALVVVVVVMTVVVAVAAAVVVIMVVLVVVGDGSSGGGDSAGELYSRLFKDPILDCTHLHPSFCKDKPSPHWTKPSDSEQQKTIKKWYVIDNTD